MATAHVLGSAEIEYTPPGGTPVVHLLGAPLREFRVVDRRARWDWWSRDGTVRHTVKLAKGVHEIVATARYDNDPVGFLVMIGHALEDNVTLNYRAEAEGEVFPVKVVAVVGAGADEVPVDRDRARFVRGEYECRLHLRRVDGGTLDGLLNGARPS